MYNERLLIQSKSTFQIDFSIVFMQRGRKSKDRSARKVRRRSKSKRKGKRRSHHRKLRKQADEGEITEFEEVEVVRRPAHSRMRSKLKWKQVVEPPKIVQPESTATTSEGTSTTTSSTASTMSSIMQPPSLSSTVALSTDITSSHESEEEGNKLVAEDEDELKLKKEMEKRKTEKKQRESIRKMSKKQAKRLSEKVESKSKATEMESITAKTRRKLTKMGTKRGKILDDATESQYEEKAGEEINKILNNKFIEEPKKTDLIEDISRYIKESGKRETEKQKVVIGLGSEIPQISTSSISTVSTESSSRRMIEKTAKDKLLEESKSEMPKVEHKFMKLSTPISDTQSSQSAESEAESESNPETQSLQSNETISKQRTMSPSSVSATEKESVSKSLIKSSTPPATSLTESTAKQETKLLTSSLPLLRSLIQTAAQLRIITTARSLTKPEIDLSSTVTPIESVKIIEKQQSTEPSMSLKESITVPRTEFPTATSMSSESPEQPETELSISPALPSTESAKTTEAQQSAVSIKEFVIMSSEYPTQPSMSFQSPEQPETELSISPALPSTESAKTTEAQQSAVSIKELLIMSSESPTQPSMSSESLEKPETELSTSPALKSTESAKTAEAQQLAVPRKEFITMSSENPTQPSLSSESPKQPETELSISPALPSTESVKTTEVQQSAMPLKEFVTMSSESPTQPSMSSESLEKPETEISISPALLSIESVKTAEAQQSAVPRKEFITMSSENPTQPSLSSESPEQPETELSISPALQSTESVKTVEAQQLAVPRKEFITMSSESPTQPSMSSESLEKPETELSISPALPSIESAKTTEAQQLARKEFITMSSENPTQPSLSSESPEQPETELSISPALQSTESVKTVEAQQLAVPRKEFITMSSESPTQPSMSSESLEKPETELSISPALPSIESAKTTEAQQLARKEFITMSSESPTQQSMSSESLENPKTELSILPVSSSTKSTKKLGTEVLVSSFLPIAESVSSSPKIEIASTSLASGMKKLTGDVESKSTTETLSISSSSRNEESKLTAESTKLLSIPATMTNELKLGILMKENKTDREMVIPLYEANLNAEKDLKVAGTAEDIAEPSKNETLSSRKEKKKSEDDESESSDDEKNLKKIRS